MEDGGGVPPTTATISMANNDGPQSIWSEANHSTQEYPINEINRIIGDNRYLQNRTFQNHPAGTSAAFGIQPPSSSLASAFNNSVEQSPSAVTTNFQNVQTTRSRYFSTANVTTTQSANYNAQNRYSLPNTMNWGPPPAENSTDRLLRTLISKIEVGFMHLNSNINAQYMTSVNHQSRPPPHPNDQRFPSQNQSSNEQRTAPIQQPVSTERSGVSQNQQPPPPVNASQSQPPVVNQATTPQNDNISRLENIVSQLASQVQDLTFRINSVPTLSNHPDASPQGRPGGSNFAYHSEPDRRGFEYYPHNGSHSHKTWPNKWNIKFNGNNEKMAVEFFVDHIAYLKNVNDVPWEQVFTHFHSFLEDIALKWFLRYKKTQTVLNWDKMREEMITRFRGAETDESIWCKITNRKQEDRETFDKFYNSILDLHDRLADQLSDAQMIGILRNNLKHETQKCLVAVVPANLNEFVNKCRQTDNLLYPHLYKQYQPFTKKVSEIESHTCYDEKSFDVEAFAHKRSQNFPTSPNAKCWNCDKLGHSYQICEEVRKIFCYLCGYKNVTCKNCPKCSQNFQFLGNKKEPPPGATAPTLED